MQIDFHRTFGKDADRLPKKVRAKLKERIELFGQQRFHPTLRNHELVGRYSGFMSINITGDIRALYRIVAIDHIEFVRVGTHSQLY